MGSPVITNLPRHQFNLYLTESDFQFSWQFELVFFQLVYLVFFFVSCALFVAVTNAIMVMFEVQFNWIGQYEIILLSVQFFNFSIKICVTFHLI